MVSVKAVAMQSPWATRRRVKTVRSCVKARSEVGTASTTRLIQMPFRRSILRPKNATPRLANAMPKVLALTAKPIAARLTPNASTSDGRIACAAKRSTSVRKAISVITP